MCEKMYNAIVTAKADIVASGTNVTYEGVPIVLSDETYYRMKFKGLRNVDIEIVQGTDVSVWNKIFKKEIIDKYDIRFPFGLTNEDACFFIKYLFVSKTIYYLAESLYIYVRRPGSIMSNVLYHRTSRALDHVDIIYDIISFMERYGLKKKHEDILIWIIIAYTYHAIHYGTETIYREVFNKGAEFCKDIDLNLLVSGEYSRDDIIRVYAFKKNNPEMYFNQTITADIEPEDKTITADIEPEDKKILFPCVFKSYIFFPWYIYKTSRIVHNSPVQKKRPSDLIKAYLFFPYFILKTYRTVLKKSGVLR
jgi:hypothetical protein